MKKHFLRTGCYLFAAFLLTGALTTGCAKKNAVKIGVIVPLSGNDATMGLGMKRGAELAVKHANERPDVKAKKITFELFAVDDAGNPQEAVNGANQLITDPRVVGVVGHLNSQCSIPAAPVYEKKNMVMISPASTNPDLTHLGLKNVFRVCTTDNVQGSYAANFVTNKMKLTRLAILDNNTTYGKGLAAEFRKQFEKNGGTVVFYDQISKDDKDFRSVLTKMKQKAPQAIYYGGMYAEGSLLSRQAKDLQLNVPLIGGDGIFSPDFIKVAGKAAEGDIATMVGLPPDRLKTAKDFFAAFRKEYPGEEFQPYDAYTYDATGIIVDAVMHVGADRKAVMEYVRKINYKGALGETQFDANGDTLNKTITVYKVEKGKFVPID